MRNSSDIASTASEETGEFLSLLLNSSFNIGGMGSAEEGVLVTGAVTGSPCCLDKSSLFSLDTEETGSCLEPVLALYFCGLVSLVLPLCSEVGSLARALTAFARSGGGDTVFVAPLGTSPLRILFEE